MFSAVKEVFQYRELLLSLTMRSIKARYKQTFLGIAWAMFLPLAMMLIFTFVFSKIARVSTGNIPYPIFAYCGLLPWTFFSGSLGGAVGSLVGNANLVTKIYFPREVFPFSAILSKFVDFCIASVIMVGLMLYYRIDWHLTILLVPFILLIQIILTTGLSLLLSMGHLFFRDVGYVFGVLILLWMFATSVIYPIEVESPLLQRILMLNPMTPIINAYRALILEGKLPNMGPIAIAAGVSVVILCIGWVWFHKTEHLFAENI